MLKRNKRFITTVAASVGMFLSIVLSSVSDVSAASPRLWGQDRYETAAAVSKQGWETSDYVILASGEGYADALCAAPLAKKYNAPILLTEGKGLNSKTVEEIKRLNAKHIIIIGKYASISQDAEQALSTIVNDVKRLGGSDRYETSVIVAKELGSIDKVVVTSGYGFADALSIAPIAAQQNMPILLTAKSSLPQVVENYINENKPNIKSSYIIGGAGSISDETAQKVSQSAVRLGGANRFETNLNVMKHFKDQLKFDKLYVVQADGPTGMEFADALSGAAIAAKTSSPVILSYKTISSEVENFVKENVKQDSTIITALGGVAAVPETIVTRLEGFVSPTTPQVPVTPQPGIPGGGGVIFDNGLDAEKRQELKAILDKLDKVIGKLKTENERNIAQKVSDVINSALNDSSYNFKTEASKVKSQYKALSSEEKDDFITQVTKYMSLGELYDLKAQFGL